MYKDICHLYRNFGNVVAGKLVMLNNVVNECDGDKQSSLNTNRTRPWQLTIAVT